MAEALDSLISWLTRDQVNLDSKRLLKAVSDNDLNEVTKVLATPLDKSSLLQAKNMLGLNAFSLACMLGKEQIVKAFLDHSFTINDDYFTFLSAQDNRGCNGLMLSSYKGHLEVVKLILNMLPLDVLEKMILTRDQAGKNSFILAAETGRTEILEFFITKKDALTNKVFDALVGTKDYTGLSAFSWAAIKDQAATLTMLLNSKEQLGTKLFYDLIGATDEKGQSALTIAVIDGKEAAAQAILTSDVLISDPIVTKKLVLNEDGKQGIFKLLTSSKIQQLLAEFKAKSLDLN